MVYGSRRKELMVLHPGDQKDQEAQHEDAEILEIIQQTYAAKGMSTEEMAETIVVMTVETVEIDEIEMTEEIAKMTAKMTAEMTAENQKQNYYARKMWTPHTMEFFKATVSSSWCGIQQAFRRWTIRR